MSWLCKGTPTFFVVDIHQIHSRRSMALLYQTSHTSSLLTCPPFRLIKSLPCHWIPCFPPSSSGWIGFVFYSKDMRGTLLGNNKRLELLVVALQVVAERGLQRGLAQRVAHKLSTSKSISRPIILWFPSATLGLEECVLFMGFGVPFRSPPQTLSSSSTASPSTLCANLFGGTHHLIHGRIKYMKIVFYLRHSQSINKQ